MKPKILVVEDKPENQKAAKESYSTSDEYQFDFAQDYDKAMNALRVRKYKGIITDCFMPKNIGTGNIDLGLSLVERLAPLTPEIKQKRAKFLEILNSYKDFLDIDNALVRKLLYIHDGQSIPPCVLDLNNYYVLMKVKTYNDKIKATEYFLKTGGVPVYSGQNDRWGQASEDYGWILEQMMQDTEAAQPLGILIIDYAKKQGIPHFMLTSRHDQIGETILRKWCYQNVVSFGWPTESEKRNPDSHYWQQALESIEKQIIKNANN